MEGIYLRPALDFKKGTIGDMLSLLNAHVRVPLLEVLNGEAGFSGDNGRTGQADAFEALDEAIIRRQRHPLLVPAEKTLHSHDVGKIQAGGDQRSEEHTSELQSHSFISY